MHRPEHLRRRFIRGLIRLADLREQFTVDRPDGADVCTILKEGMADTPANRLDAAIEDFISSLVPEAQAELIAVYHLGREPGSRAKHYAATLEHARGTLDSGTADYLSGKTNLAQALRRGKRLLWPAKPNLV